jgi:hypothetical protein
VRWRRCWKRRDTRSIESIATDPHRWTQTRKKDISPQRRRERREDRFGGLRPKDQNGLNPFLFDFGFWKSNPLRVSAHSSVAGEKKRISRRVAEDAEKGRFGWLRQEKPVKKGKLPFSFDFRPRNQTQLCVSAYSNEVGEIKIKPLAEPQRTQRDQDFTWAPPND